MRSKESDGAARNLSIYSDLIESDAALRAGAIFLRLPYLLWRIIHHKRYLMILICITWLSSNTTPFSDFIRSQILILSLSDQIYDRICIRSDADFRKFTFSAKRNFFCIPGLESKTNLGNFAKISGIYPGFVLLSNPGIQKNFLLAEKVNFLKSASDLIQILS